MFEAFQHLRLGDRFGAGPAYVAIAEEQRFETVEKGRICKGFSARVAECVCA